MERIMYVALIALWTVSAGAISIKDVFLGFSNAPAGSSNEVRSLPGYRRQLPSKHFSGYITVDEDHGRQLFYYLVLSESLQPSQDLVIWLTGGPGCSSMDAFTYEHGPFSYSFKQGSDGPGRTPSLNDIILTPNPNSWAKAASVLYIDSPAGTGFSYSAVQADYTTDDGTTMDDLQVFVGRFFEQYPELMAKRLFVAGESYGGVYVPLLARRLLHHNQRLAAAAAAAAGQASSSSNLEARSRSGGVNHAAAAGQRYNLVGYIVGNAVTDDEFDTNGQVDFAYGLGLIDPGTYHHVRSTCKEHYWNASAGSPCGNALDHMESVMGPINQYDILGTCFVHPDNNQGADSNQIADNNQIADSIQGAHSSQGADDSQVEGSEVTADVPQQRQLQQAPGSGPVRRSWPHAAAFPADHSTPITNMYALHKAAAAAAAARAGDSSRGGGVGSGMLGHTISCADRRHALLYYNHPTVRRAIHAATVEEAGRWEPCSDVLHYTHTAGSMIPVHQELLAGGLRALVLSGDHDYVVPFTGSRAWVYSLDMTEVKPWHAWNLPGSKQVSGYAVEFDGGLTYATVKGGGHMVPQTKPQEALALLQLWLDQKL